jgi:hypothetical protein
MILIQRVSRLRRAQRATQVRPLLATVLNLRPQNQLEQKKTCNILDGLALVLFRFSRGIYVLF